MNWESRELRFIGYKFIRDKKSIKAVLGGVSDFIVSESSLNQVQ